MKPEQIIIFRYGFKGLQLTQALDAELKLIIEACKLFDEKWSPKLLAIKFFEPEGPVPFDRDLNLREFDELITIRPLEYEVVIDQVDLSAGGLQDLVNSLSYVRVNPQYWHELRIEAIDLVVPLCYGPKRTHKEPKTRIEPDEVNLERVREYITDFEELAIYALGRMNGAQPDNKKYEFEQYLYGQHAYCGVDSSKLNKWQHVSMYAKEVNGERKIIFAELCYSNGEYEPVVHSVLDPNDRASYKLGCGFCFPALGGRHPSPHPADRSKYVAGHWPNVKGWFSHPADRSK